MSNSLNEAIFAHVCRNKIISLFTENVQPLCDDPINSSKIMENLEKSKYLFEQKSHFSVRKNLSLDFSFCLSTLSLVRILRTLTLPLGSESVVQSSVWIPHVWLLALCYDRTPVSVQVITGLL